MPIAVGERVYDHIYDPIYKKSCANTTSNLHDSAAHGIGQLPYSSSIEVASVSVSGASRYKYFRKPLVQHLYSFEPILTAPSKEDYIIGKKHLLDESFARTAANTQALYRESETQTEPYSHPYFFRQRLSSTVATSTDAKDPGILINNHFICSKGQLPGPKEITCICRNSERREKAKELPSVSDEKTLKIHKAFLEGQEQLEFKARERELDEILAMRLASFKENLYAKYAESERRAEEKLVELQHHRASHSVPPKKGPRRNRKCIIGYEKDKTICTTLERTDTLNICSAPAWASIIQLSSDLTSLHKSKSQTTLMEEHGQRSENRQALALKKDLKRLLSGMNSKQI